MAADRRRLAAAAALDPNRADADRRALPQRRVRITAVDRLPWPGCLGDVAAGPVDDGLDRGRPRLDDADRLESESALRERHADDRAASAHGNARVGALVARVADHLV